MPSKYRQAMISATCKPVGGAAERVSWRPRRAGKVLVKPFKNLAAAAVALAVLIAPAAQADSTVVIVRHAEKPSQGLGQLTCQGLNRSLALAPVLLSRYGKPSAIYAPNPAQLKKDHGVPYAYIRPLATIEPLAVRAGMPVNLQWGMTDIPAMGDELLATSGVHVVAWEHHWGENLARYLMSRMGGDPRSVPEWMDDDFDSIYVVRISDADGGSKRASFSRESEGLNGLAEACP